MSEPYTDAHRLAQTLTEQRDGMDGTTQATAPETEAHSFIDTPQWARLRQRIATLGLVDGLTASPSDVEGFLAECIADYRALRERHGRAMNQSQHFWLSSFLMVLEDIQKRYRLEQAQRHDD